MKNFKPAQMRDHAQSKATNRQGRLPQLMLMRQAHASNPSAAPFHVFQHATAAAAPARAEHTLGHISL